jgi:hypothetical protein
MPKDPSNLPQASGPCFDSRILAVHNDMLEKIAKHGWTTLGIFGTEKGELSFAYTVGARLIGLPDLIISGLSPSSGSTILNAILSEAKKGLELREGLAYPQFANMPLILKCLKPAQARDRMYQTFGFYKIEIFDVFQVVYPDPNGIFPEAEGYHFDRQEFFWQH